VDGGFGDFFFQERNKSSFGRIRSERKRFFFLVVVFFFTKRKGKLSAGEIPTHRCVCVCVCVRLAPTTTSPTHPLTPENRCVVVSE